MDNLGKGAPDYDPRPEKFRRMANFTDHVYNETINHCANTNKDITMRHAIPTLQRTANKADIVHDHHYVGCLDKV